MDHEAKAKSIIHEGLSVYDGFHEKRDAVIKEIAAAIASAYETGMADERAKLDLEAHDAKVSATAAAEEREACAKIAEAYKSKDIIEVFAKMENTVAASIAQNIRARSNAG